MPFRKLLVPHDFSDNANQALRLALDLLPPRGGRLVVLHVVVPIFPATELPVSGMPYLDPIELASGAKQRLDAVVRKAVGRRNVRTTCRVEVGQPTDRIVAAGRGMDAIVMSTVGRTGLDHLLIGSVAERVVRHASVPVLTLRPRRRRGKKKR